MEKRIIREMEKIGLIKNEYEFYEKMGKVRVYDDITELQNIIRSETDYERICEVEGIELTWEQQGLLESLQIRAEDNTNVFSLEQIYDELSELWDSIL